MQHEERGYSKLQAGRLYPALKVDHPRPDTLRNVPRMKLMPIAKRDVPQQRATGRA